MKHGKGLFLSFFIVIGLLTGCSSIEDETKETIAAVEETFKGKAEEANSKNEDISFYIPSTMKIEEREENNVIINKDDQTFILFVNPVEPANSDVMYKSIESKKKFSVDKTFTDKERFGYVKVYEIDEKLYLVSVGIGGVKMTTEAKLSEVSESAKEMMTVVSSVKY
ncbi:hypothetical protein [Fredinandcohnia sp. 179-A 10B2 NHS]|uniref:hypothetical protein n=1 Tax=Fredinandcohnia sp. 179-A 10B2 NHS TaxID=3235176 RepID=UPI00399F413B